MSGFVLTKASLPDVWDKRFTSEDELITELRKHICGVCLRSGDEISGIVDVKSGDGWIECRDLVTLLSTPCGCEFDVTDADEFDALEEEYVGRGTHEPHVTDRKD